MKLGYRSAIFEVPDSGAYVQVFQRPGEGVLLEANFFGGDTSLEEMLAKLKALSDAVAFAGKWSSEGSDVVVPRLTLIQD